MNENDKQKRGVASVTHSQRTGDDVRWLFGVRSCSRSHKSQSGDRDRITVAASDAMNEMAFI